MLSRLYSAYSTIRTFNSNPLADIANLKKGLISNSTFPDESLVKRLLISYHKAKARQKNITLPYQSAGEWGGDIKRRRADYLKALEDNNIAALSGLLMNFCRNGGVAGLYRYSSYQTINSSNALHKKWFINCILHDYAVWQELLEGADVKSLGTPLAGNPWGYVIDNILVTSVSCFHNYYANQVSSLISDISYPVVAEIGGGFGGVANYLLSSGKCRYINFDLPEVILIAQYYLITAFPEKKVLLFGEGSDFDNYDIILMPNFEIQNLPNNYVDLFINTRSLSEMDYHTIEEYLKQIDRTCKTYFLHENSVEEIKVRDGFVETPSQKFPMPKTFKRIYKSKSLWKSGRGRYWSYLYQKCGKTE